MLVNSRVKKESICLNFSQADPPMSETGVNYYVQERRAIYESMSWMRLSSIPIGSRCILGEAVLHSLHHSNKKQEQDSTVNVSSILLTLSPIIF